MRSHNRRRILHIPDLVFELIRFPGCPIAASLDNDLGTSCGHNPEQTVAVERAKPFDMPVPVLQQWRPIALREERLPKERSAKRQYNDNQGDQKPGWPAWTRQLQRPALFFSEMRPDGITDRQDTQRHGQ